MLIKKIVSTSLKSKVFLAEALNRLQTKQHPAKHHATNIVQSRSLQSNCMPLLRKKISKISHKKSSLYQKITSQ